MVRTLNQQEKNAIIETISSEGWKIIEEILDDQILSLRLPKNVSKKKRFEDIAIETLGKAYAARKIERLFKQISNLKPIKKSELKSWA